MSEPDPVDATRRWAGFCLVVGTVFTLPSSFLLHPSLYDPDGIAEVLREVAHSHTWHWLHVFAALGGTSLVGGYTLWWHRLSERRHGGDDGGVGPMLTLALGASWIALTLWLPLVTFEAAGLPRITRFLYGQQLAGVDGSGWQAAVEITHGIWAAMLATAYLIAWLAGAVALLLTESEAKSPDRVLPRWIRVPAWIASAGSTLILPVAWAIPSIAAGLLFVPGAAYFLWTFATGLHLVAGSRALTTHHRSSSSVQ